MDVFKGVGQYEKEYHMQLNVKVEGIIQQPRRILYATQPKLIMQNATFLCNCDEVVNEIKKKGPQKLQTRYKSKISLQMLIS